MPAHFTENNPKLFKVELWSKVEEARLPNKGFRCLLVPTQNEFVQSPKLIAFFIRNYSHSAKINDHDFASRENKIAGMRIDMEHLVGEGAPSVKPSDRCGRSISFKLTGRFFE